MATESFTEARLNGGKFAESSLDDPADFSAPPLAPTERPAASILLRQEAIGHTLRNEHFFQPPDKWDLRGIETIFGSRRQVIAGSAVAAALGVAALVYFFPPSSGEKPPAQTAESAPAVTLAVAPVQVAAVQTAPTIVPPLSATTDNAVAWPDLPPFVTAQTSPPALTRNTATSQSAPPGKTRRSFFRNVPA
jgi:hypothetical protein